MDMKYIKPGFDHAKWHLLEEMSEVAKALCKAERFGYDSAYPIDGATNKQNLRAEIADLRAAMDNFINELMFKA